jgi:nitrite reductase/ring-hydroxylating ferredoxin subunit
MCQYKRFDIQSGEVVEKGEVDCEWHPYELGK